MSKLTFASDYQIFFGDYNPNLQKWDEYQTTFSKTDNVRFAPFVLQFPEDNSFDRGMAMVIADLTDCAGALGMKLAQVKVIAPNIIWALVIADCRLHPHHKLSPKKLASWHRQDNHHLRISTKKFTTIFIFSATTAAGSISLHYSDARRFQYLGNFTTFGVFAAKI